MLKHIIKWAMIPHCFDPHGIPFNSHCPIEYSLVYQEYLRQQEERNDLESNHKQENNAD